MCIFGKGIFSRAGLLLAGWLGCALISQAVAQAPATNSVAPAQAASAGEQVVLPPAVPDPLEPLNRALFDFNRFVLTDIVRPTAKGYRFVVRRPVRTAIGNAGRNLLYPARVLNHLLQGRWEGARTETDRFFVNSVMGVGGLFDVATRFEIPKTDADFGQTMGHWGWEPDFYLMLPIFGPSSDRDAVGLGVDTAANPITYFTPYSYATYGITYNNISDTGEGYARFNEAQMDSYSELEYEWTFARETRAPDFRVKGKQDAASLETLQSALIKFQEPEFPERGRTGEALIPATGKKLKYTYWLQRRKAPVVYLIPGLGAHRFTDLALSLDEFLYQKGFSVVSISSPYNYEFMENASTAAMPAYTPVDGHDLHVALTEIDHQLEQANPGRLGARALTGYSMGGFLSLYLAATEGADAGLLKFDRYLAIDAPVRLSFGVAKLDELYNAPLAWPAAERNSNMENALLKVSVISQESAKELAAQAQAPPPFDEIEAKFLIGMTFRFILRDVIYTSQQRNNQGILRQPLNPSRRNPVYQEIMRYSYTDYFQKFALAYYQQRGGEVSTAADLDKAGDLRTYAAGLRANRNVRLIVNQNDFLLPAADLQWYRDTLAPDQISVFEHGGHLGNLARPEVRQAILKGLEDLKTSGGR